jgi:hypothetical protein
MSACQHGCRFTASHVGLALVAHDGSSSSPCRLSSRRPAASTGWAASVCSGGCLPLARPAIGAVAIFTFLHSWNLYLEPIVFLSSKQKFTIPQALTQYVDAYGGPMWNTQLAAATLSALPVLIIFVLAQRQFVEGLAQTGLKG